MRRVLMICNTYYQLIVAIQLRLTVYREDFVGVLLSDYSVKADYVADNLRKAQVFDVVYYEELLERRIRHAHSSNIAKAKRLFSISTGLGEERYLNIIEDGFDTVIFRNLDYCTYEIVDSAIADKREAMIFRMEEGLVSCDSNHISLGLPSRSYETIESLRGILHRPQLYYSVGGFYCFIPQLCDDRFPMRPIAIPSVRLFHDEFINALKKAFGYDGFPYEQKYIFFASSQDADGTPIGETQLIIDFANLVGRENLLVKKHPRDKRRIYEDLGIAVMKDSFVPWEVIQMCTDLSDRELVSCASGAPLAVTAMQDVSTSVSYLRPENPSDEEMANFEEAIGVVSRTLNKLHRLNMCLSVHEKTLSGF